MSIKNKFKLVITLVFILLLLVIGLWFGASTFLRNKLSNLSEVQIDTVNISGFPSQLRIFLDNIVYNQRNFSLHVKNVNTTTLLYNPSKTLVYSEGPYILQSIFGPQIKFVSSNILGHITLDSSTINTHLNFPKPRLDISKLKSKKLISLQADHLLISTTTKLTEDIIVLKITGNNLHKINNTKDFSLKNIYLELDTRNTNALPTYINIQNAHTTLTSKNTEIIISTTGTIESKNGYMDGEIRLSISDIDKLMKLLVDKGVVDNAVRGAVDLYFAFNKFLKPRTSKYTTIPFRFHNRKTYIGIFHIGIAPRLK